MNKKNSIIIAVALIIALVGLIVLANVLKGNNAEGSKENLTQSNASTANKILNIDELFTDRDLKQEADLTGATKLEVSDDTDVNITKEGIYIISGTAKNATINVEVGDEEKVQLVLNDLNITNIDKECIHVENADKVFITTSTQCNLSYSVTDAENATGAILSRDDITFNGAGILTINSDNNGIVGKDDIKITGGIYNITASKNCIRANDSIRIAGGTFELKAGTDGLHAENNDDDAKGYIYINSCTLNINADDDALHAVTIVQIDGGTIKITAGEGIEGTYVQINDGSITIDATDDGINAAQKSSAYTPTVVINGGDIKINMGPGDTDGVDSNGDIIVNGGTIDVTGNSTFDYENKAEHNGGTIIINGEETETIPNQFGGMRGGKNGQMTPPDFNGEFDGQMTPPNFDGKFDENMTPPDFNGESNGQTPPEGFKKGRFNREERSDQDRENFTPPEKPNREKESTKSE